MPSQGVAQLSSGAQVFETEDWNEKMYCQHFYIWHSSDAHIKFLLSVKKHRSNNKTFKNHGQITLTKLLNPKTVIEKLLTIKLRDKGKQLSINSISDQIAKMLRAPKSMLSFFKDLPMLLSDFPTIESEPDFGQC